MRLAVDVAGEVLGRPAELEEHLLEVAALAGVDDDRVGVDALADQRLDLGGAQHLLEDRSVDGLEDQAVRRVVEQLEPPVAVHRLGDVDEQGVRDRVAAVLQQRVDDLLGVVPGGPGVPQAERGQAIGVDVLRGALELGERRDGAAALVGVLVVDLEQEGLVGLDDQRSVGHAVPSPGVIAPVSNVGPTTPNPERVSRVHRPVTNGCPLGRTGGQPSCGPARLRS